MTIEELNSLSSRPSMNCTWGGRTCLLTSIDHKTKTCYIRLPGRRNMKPYPVSYQSVVLLSKQARRSKKNNINDKEIGEAVTLRQK